MILAKNFDAWRLFCKMASFMFVAALTGLSACKEPPVAGGHQAAVISTKSRAPQQVAVGHKPDLRLEQAEVIFQGPWGHRAGQVGRDSEGSRPGPMSITPLADGGLLVLDQENQRVVRLGARGELHGILPLQTRTALDLVASGEQVWVLYYFRSPGPGHAVGRLQKSGSLERVARYPGTANPTGLFMTGLAQAPDLWIEEEHDAQVRVVVSGQAAGEGARPLRVLGRPDRSRPGLRLTASRTGTHRATVLRVRPGVSTERLLDIKTPMPLMAIHELDSDAAGRIYVGLLMGRESSTPQTRSVLVVTRGEGGRTHSVVELPPAQAMDTFRPLAVADNGAIFHLHGTEQGVTIRRWAAPDGGEAP